MRFIWNGLISASLCDRMSAMISVDLRCITSRLSTAEDYRLIGAEALLRWKNEKFGSVSPALFIPILEESGLIIPVGQYVLWGGCENLQEMEAVYTGVSCQREFILCAAL